MQWTGIGMETVRQCGLVLREYRVGVGGQQTPDGVAVAGRQMFVVDRSFQESGDAVALWRGRGQTAFVYEDLFHGRAV